MKQLQIEISDEDIRKIYLEDISLHEAAARLNMTVVTLWRRALKLNLKWSDKQISKKWKKIPLSEILNGDHPYFQTLKLKKRLIKEGIKENKCEICNIDSWNNKPISMQLDHIDGNPHNHILDNLRMVCPNCHSQTLTYCGKNN